MSHERHPEYPADPPARQDAGSITTPTTNDHPPRRDGCRDRDGDRGGDRAAADAEPRYSLPTSLIAPRPDRSPAVPTSRSGHDQRAGTGGPGDGSGGLADPNADSDHDQDCGANQHTTIAGLSDGTGKGLRVGPTDANAGDLSAVRDAGAGLGLQNACANPDTGPGSDAGRDHSRPARAGRQLTFCRVKDSPIRVVYHGADQHTPVGRD